MAAVNENAFVNEMQNVHSSERIILFYFSVLLFVFTVLEDIRFLFSDFLHSFIWVVKRKRVSQLPVIVYIMA